MGNRRWVMMKGLLVIIIFLAVVVGASYGFAATLVITNVDDIGNQTDTISFQPDIFNPDNCTFGSGTNVFPGACNVE